MISLFCCFVNKNLVTLFLAGDISLKEVLPVNHLYFGQISQNGGSHTLGRLECAGESTTEQIAISCQDLWRTGYTLNGLYPVNKNSKVELVYCDFSQGKQILYLINFKQVSK